MLPSFLVPEAVVREDGQGPGIGLDSSQGKLLLLTLGITRNHRAGSLDVFVWGSPRQRELGRQTPGVSSQKFYCGTYQLVWT